MEIGRDLIEFLDTLERYGVDYLVVVGMAVGLHGRPRYTKDLDVLLRREPVNVSRLLAAIDDFGLSSLGLKAEDFLEPGMVVQIGYEPNRVDILTSVVGVSFEQALEGRRRETLGGVPVWVIGLEALIKVKRLAGRPQDLLDAEALENVEHPAEGTGGTVTGKVRARGGGISPVVRRFRLGEEPDPLLEWAGRPWAEKWLVLMELRTFMPQVTGNPIAPIEPVAFKRRLGEPGVDRPERPRQEGPL